MTTVHPIFWVFCWAWCLAPTPVRSGPHLKPRQPKTAGHRPAFFPIEKRPFLRQPQRECPAPAPARMPCASPSANALRLAGARAPRAGQCACGAWPRSFAKQNSTPGCQGIKPHQPKTAGHRPAVFPIEERPFPPKAPRVCPALRRARAPRAGQVAYGAWPRSFEEG